MRRIRTLLASLLLVPAWRTLMVRLRLFYLVRLRRRLRTLQSEHAFDATLPHNLAALGQCNPRIDLLIKPLSVLEVIDASSRVLVIGPRNEHDLLTLVAHGFGKDRVRGLDLISYSPAIDLGDMHRTPYADNAWDVIVVGWTLSYSSAPEQFAAELTRITKPGGIIAIAVEYSTMSESDETALAGYNIQETAKLAKRINSVREILDLFGPRAGHVYFSHDAPRKRSHGADGLVSDVSNVAVIFSLEKS